MLFMENFDDKEMPRFDKDIYTFRLKVNARLINNRENKGDNLDKIIDKYLTFT